MSDKTEDKPLRVRMPIGIDYKWCAGPASTDYLTGLKEGRLYGRRCPVCELVYFPPRNGVCARDGVMLGESVEVGPKEPSPLSASSMFRFSDRPSNCRMSRRPSSSMVRISGSLISSRNVRRPTSVWACVSNPCGATRATGIIRSRTFRTSSRRVSPTRPSTTMRGTSDA